MTDVTTLLRAALADHSDPGALERADAALRSRRRQVGDYGWCGDTCLQCTEITSYGSHREREVARYDEDTGTSACPTCGAVVHWPAPPGVRDDPRCPDCQDCPATMRDPSVRGDDHV